MATSRPELGSSLLVEQQLAPPCAEALVPLGQRFPDSQDAYPGSKGGRGWAGVGGPRASGLLQGESENQVPRP